MIHKDPEIQKKLTLLAEKYEAMGQDIHSYLDGLLHSDYLTYWDYIHLDSLLSLQKPQTGFKDEMIFIGYHQITELYFKLILWEMDQIAEYSHPDIEVFETKLKRINQYFSQLVESFSIMSEGMDPKEFLQFRMSLLPASGFQSAQFRLIEISATDLDNLVAKDYRSQTTNDPVPAKFEHIYWKKGANELSSGKKTLTLLQFEKKYTRRLLRKIDNRSHNNINRIFTKFYQHNPKNGKIKEELKKFDQLCNIEWRQAHLKSAGFYLNKDAKVIEATGGSNWQKYLPPRFQKIIFFPDLLTEQEKEEWGKNWLLKQMRKSSK